MFLACYLHSSGNKTPPKSALLLSMAAPTGSPSAQSAAQWDRAVLATRSCDCNTHSLTLGHTDRQSVCLSERNLCARARGWHFAATLGRKSSGGRAAPSCAGHSSNARPALENGRRLRVAGQPAQTIECRSAGGRPAELTIESNNQHTPLAERRVHWPVLGLRMRRGVCAALKARPPHLDSLAQALPLRELSWHCHTPARVSLSLRSPFGWHT